MEWRRIDSMLASWCIQRVQQDIKKGERDLGNLETVATAEQFNAWRVHILDRMMEEHDKNQWGDDPTNPTTELEEDVRYFKRLLEQEANKNKK